MVPDDMSAKLSESGGDARRRRNENQPPLHSTMSLVSRIWDNRVVRITLLMIGWYITSIAAGIYNKAYLNVHPLPVLLTMAQSVIDVVCCVVFLYLFLAVQFPRTASEIKILAMLGLFHCVGTLLTNWSTLESSASFTHTIKVRPPPPSTHFRLANCALRTVSSPH